METAFSWLGQIFEALLLFVPRIFIIRATHGGVKWRHGSKVFALSPGLHVYWPLVSEVDVIVVARQTLRLPKQILTTSDNKKVVVGTVAVYKIRDVVQAIGQANWDVDSTINDITQAAVVSVIAGRSCQELIDMITANSLNDLLAKAARKELRQFGVFISACKLTDFADCRVYKLVIDDGSVPVSSAEE